MYIIKALKIKRIKHFPFQKENQSSEFLKSRGCNREQLSLLFLFKYDVTDWTFGSSIEENDQLYFVAVVE